MSLSRRAAHALETGLWDGLVSRALASAVAPLAARALMRPAAVPEDIDLVCVGGATLGGSGKTRVAIVCAREIARAGTPVVLVGHGYRASPSAARVVSTEDRLEDVGDEALVCARAHALANVPVVVGPTRQAAIDLAVALTPRPSVLVLDGPLGIRRASEASKESTRRASEGSISVLAVDASRPWGSGRLPPAGDLRAPRERLLAIADLVVPVDATPTRVRWLDDQRTEPIASLRHRRLGLFTAIARPDRMVRALATLALHPHAVVSAPDHGPISAALRARFSSKVAGVDAWVGTPKCVLHLEGLALDAPIGVLDSEPLFLPLLAKELRETARRRARRARRTRQDECALHLHGAP